MLCQQVMSAAVEKQPQIVKLLDAPSSLVSQMMTTRVSGA